MKQAKSRAARKKPFISERNWKSRLEFAQKYANKGQIFWKNILFLNANLL